MIYAVKKLIFSAFVIVKYRGIPYNRNQEEYAGIFRIMNL